MNKFLMKLMLLIIAGIIYLLTGRNRRQGEKIPDGTMILTVYAKMVNYKHFCEVLQNH